jgi:hypothetical protein
MPLSQFQSAMSAFLKENTSEFNKRYSLQAVSPPSSRSSSPLPSRPSSPLGLSKRSNSQYELAKLALESHSPKNFNVRYGVTKRRKTRKHRKSRRSQSRRR